MLTYRVTFTPGIASSHTLQELTSPNGLQLRLGKAILHVFTVTVMGTGLDMQPLLSVTRAYTVTENVVVKFAGLAMGMVPAALVYHETALPAPPLTSSLRVIRLNTAWPDNGEAQSSMPVGNAGGKGYTVTSMVFGSRHCPALGVKVSVWTPGPAATGLNELLLTPGPDQAPVMPP